MPPIPDDHHMVFDQLVLRARQLFGSAVEEELISPDNVRLPSFRVGKLSMIGEQWIVIEINSRYPLAIRSASFIQGTRSLN